MTVILSVKCLAVDALQLQSNIAWRPNSEFCPAYFRILTPNFLKQKSTLKSSLAKIEKCKSLRLMSEDNFSKIANGDMGNFVHLWGIMALVSSTFQ